MTAALLDVAVFADPWLHLAGPQAPAVSAGPDPAAKVFAQQAADYPPDAMAWMHHATWKGPVKVPLDHVEPDMRWMDGADPDHVQDFVQLLEAGKKLKPVILVKTPGNPKLQLIDGHHRYLAYAELGKKARAWIGTVDADHGPWEAMHERQFHPSAGGGAGRGDGTQNALGPWERLLPGTAATWVAPGAWGRLRGDWEHAWETEERGKDGKWAGGGDIAKAAEDFVGQMDATDYHDQAFDMRHQGEPTEAERRALNGYRSSSTAVNSALRGKTASTPETDAAVAGLDSLTGRQHTTKELHAVRGIFGNASKVLGPTNLAGATIHDKSFTSVSLDADIAAEFMDPETRDNAVIFVTIPAGTHATAGVEEEFELILARGGSYKVTRDGVDPADGVRKLFVEAQ